MKTKHGVLLLGSAIISITVLTAPGCDRTKEPAPQQQPQMQAQPKALVIPQLKWVDLLTQEIKQWDINGRDVGNSKCGHLAGNTTPDLFQACLREKVPEDVRSRSWSIPLYTGPSITSTPAGEVRITGKVLGGFTLQYVSKDGAAVPFEPDDTLSYAETETLNHTVLEQRENWVRLPRSPFPSEVWMDASQRTVHDAEDGANTVYKWNGQSIVILEKQATGIQARQEVPTDYDCEGNAKPTPENQLKKFSIPWSDLFDENQHLRLKQKYTIC